MSARPKGTKRLALGVLIGGVAVGTGSLFFAISSVVLEYSTRKSFFFAAICIVLVMIIALPAVWIGMRTSPENLSREPMMLLLGDFIRLSIGFAVAALFALFGFGLLSGGSMAAGGLASLFALMAAYASLRRLQAVVVRLGELGNRGEKGRSEQ